ncbi:MAG: hypothetical protein ACPLPT_02710 [Moorellales bacterium]
MEKKGYPELEEVIRRVRGVASVRVFRDEEGNVSEIHVVADPRRNPKQLVRDIESAVAVAMGIQLDHKKISVVQFESGSRVEEARPEYPPSGPVEPLPVLTGLSYHLQGQQVRVEVQLELGGEVYSGSASSESQLLSPGALAAEAVLKALETRWGPRAAVRLGDAVKLRVAYRDAWVVVVETVEGPQIGAALVMREDLEAAAEATLAALAPRPRRRPA